MKGHVSSQEGREPMPSGFSERADVEYIEPAILSVGFIRDEGMSAPRPILEITLCK